MERMEALEAAEGRGRQEMRRPRRDAPVARVEALGKYPGVRGSCWCRASPCGTTGTKAIQRTMAPRVACSAVRWTSPWPIYVASRPNLRRCLNKMDRDPNDGLAGSVSPNLDRSTKHLKCGLQYCARVRRAAFCPSRQRMGIRTVGHHSPPLASFVVERFQSRIH